MRSDLVKKGSTRAAHRSLFYALGLQLLIPRLISLPVMPIWTTRPKW